MSSGPTGLALLFALLPAPSLPEAHPAASHLASAIALRRERVAEFRLIKEAAQELGIRVWLFGGTAAGFAHYVRWDLAREGGDERYRESFFDYDFTNIYRSTQDADLVVDSTPEQAERLESLIKQKMSFLQGSKEHWEVRLLRQDRVAPGGQVKQALLQNPDFLGQNTDSNSTGMIELTEPPAGEGVVRDLRDWDSATPFFLSDVAEGRLHYYLSPTHQRTSRSLAGDNPPIFSVIRYLVKAFQYDLAIEDQDRATIQSIIDAFDPTLDYARMSPWARGWLERYGPNLIRHAVNIEYGWNTLAELGLREKLISLSRPSEEGTLGWWLSREPLRTRAVGSGTGRTAGALGIEIVAHETRDFLAYESITRDTTLRPNVLISRPGHPGEGAALGPGFYTKRGRTGAVGSGLTIRFRVDPRAREGADFTVHDQVVLVSNRAALQVIPESLEASWLEYFQMLARGLNADPSDRGVWIKLRRRVSLKPVTAVEEAEIASLVGAALDQARSRRLPPVVLEWMDSPLAQGQPALEKRLVALISEEIRRLPERPPDNLANPPRLLKAWFIDHPSLARQHPELVEELLANLPQESELVHVGTESLVIGLLKDPAWKDHPEWVEALICHGVKAYRRRMAELHAGAQRKWDVHSEWRVRRGELFLRLATELLPNPPWAERWQLVQRFLEALPAALYWNFRKERLPLGNLLELPALADHPEVLVAWARATDSHLWDFIDDALEQTHWRYDATLQGLSGRGAPRAVYLRHPRVTPYGEDPAVIERVEALLRSRDASADCR